MTETIDTTYSIAEARNQFAALIHDAENHNKPVHVTRRGRLVAVILSLDEYNRLKGEGPKRDFWASYLAWREKWSVEELDLDPDDIWADVRDRTPPRDEYENPWL